MSGTSGVNKPPTSKPTKQTQDEIDTAKKQRADVDKEGAGLQMLVAAGGTLNATQQIALAAYQATVNAATNAAMSAIAQQAAIAAAALKLSNDLNDATISFTKGIGSSVKSAAQ